MVTRKAPPRLGRRLSAAQQQGVMNAAGFRYLSPIDPALLADVQRELQVRPRSRGCAAASERLIEWLVTHGQLVQTPEKPFYLWTREAELIALGSDRWIAWLYKLTGVNPADGDFAFLSSAAAAAAAEAPTAEVARVSSWDGENLRVHSFGSDVWRLDGQTIDQEANGDGSAIFETLPGWEPVAPDRNSGGVGLDWWLHLAHPHGHAEEYRLVLLVWLVATFFPELCPTRPLLLLKGEAGSGKSMLLRTLLRLLAGPDTELGGIPDKPDGFVAAAAATHLLVLDNLDQPQGWLRDKLARISTGGVDYYRRLYTSNDLATVRYRCWIAITSRTPDVLRRDDLADRLLVVPFSRLDDTERSREALFLEQADDLRPAFWGDVLALLNRVIAELLRSGLATGGRMRLGDFEALGRLVAGVLGQEDIWDAPVKLCLDDQAGLLLEDNPIAEAIAEWLKDPFNRGREVRTRVLYDELGLKLFGPNKPDAAWPKSARAFGRQLQILRRSLATRFNVSWREDNMGSLYRLGQ